MRADLLALTVEALTRLANVGLVKRAQKEIEAGTLPTIVEDADGTVVASARDGASTRLVRGVALQNTACSCGASQVCRHRIAAVLAYQASAAANPSSTAATGEASATGVAAAAAADPRWDPGTLTDAALLQACGAQLIARATAAMSHGIVVTTVPGAISTTGAATVPTVMLPTATVQFLVPHDVAYAKCDCAKGQGCEHIALAVYAFRAGPSGGVHTLGGAPAGHASTTVDATTADAIYEALQHMAAYGLAAPGTHAKLSAARGAAQRLSWLWIVDGLEAIERLADAYARQSASFHLGALAREVGEVAARLRAATAPAPVLPARWLLGSDQAAETAMEQVRLLSLGARLDADDDRRMVRMYFADPDTATVLVLDKTWPNETRNGPDLGQLFASSRMSVTNLAQGELITRAARRRANGALDLGAARGMKASLLPSTGSWETLPAPLLVRDLAAHGERLSKLPPACLTPRSLGAGIIVVAITDVQQIDCSSDGQSVTATVRDAAGTALRLHTQHRNVSPGAVDATVNALRTPATYVAGELQRTSHGWYMEPLAFFAKQLISIDLQRPAATQAATPTTGLASNTLDDQARSTGDANDAFAHALVDYLGRALLKGQRATGASGHQVAQQAATLFMHNIAERCTRAANGDAHALFDLAILHQLD